MGGVQKAHRRHIHRMSIDCFGPLMKILAKFLFLDFNKMLSYVNGFFPIDAAKIGIFRQPMLII